MSIGYACLGIAVPEGQMKSCIMKNANRQRILSLIEHNLNSLENLIDYNTQNDINLFRISSGVIPFGSSVAYELPWHEVFAGKLSAIGEKITKTGMRVSMHPGQYTVLNSPDNSVVERSIKDINYHTKFLDALGLGPEHKVIVHTGGVYGDKKLSKSRFSTNYSYLEDNVIRRLVLENDDSLFNIEDVLEISSLINIPVVYDNLHNAVNPASLTVNEYSWIKDCSLTWKKGDGLQKIHYSQQHPGRKPGAHSEFIDINTFLDFYNQLVGFEIDIMLEVKDKNLSAVKCINCTSNRGIDVLKVEWARYKYLILEHSPDIYNKIDELFVDTNAYPAIEMYKLIENALNVPVQTENAIKAAKHVKGFLKDIISETERRRFERLLTQFNSKEKQLKSIKSNLLLLARKYNRDDLLNGYYLYNM